MHGQTSVLSEYNADPTGVARDLSKVVLEQVAFKDDKKVFCDSVILLIPEKMVLVIFFLLLTFAFYVID